MTSISWRVFPALEDFLHARTKSDLRQLELENATGRSADLGREIGRSTTRLILDRNERVQLGGFASSNRMLTSRLADVQSALDGVRASIFRISSLGTGPSADVVSWRVESGSALADITRQLDTVRAGERIFSASPTSSAASIATSMAVSLEEKFRDEFGFGLSDPAAAVIAATQLVTFAESAVRDLSSSAPANPRNARQDIAPGEQVGRGPSVDHPAIRRTLATLIVADGLSRSAVDEGVIKAVMTGFVSLVHNASSDIVDLQGITGGDQQRLERTTARLEERMAALDQRIGFTEEVDPYSTVVAMNQLVNRLDASYRATARVQGLSLSKYL
jgi:flagellar hook-associated protein 3 FlgL